MPLTRVYPGDQKIIGDRGFDTAKELRTGLELVLPNSMDGDHDGITAIFRST
jgi:hypothetical protein